MNISLFRFQFRSDEVVRSHKDEGLGSFPRFTVVEHGRRTLETCASSPSIPWGSLMQSLGRTNESSPTWTHVQPTTSNEYEPFRASQRLLDHLITNEGEDNKNCSRNEIWTQAWISIAERKRFPCVQHLLPLSLPSFTTHSKSVSNPHDLLKAKPCAGENILKGKRRTE